MKQSASMGVRMVRLAVFGAVLALFPSAGAKQLKVLAIGNSFSLSMMEELPKAAAAFPGCELDIVNMYIGGCPLERHWAKETQDKGETT